MGACFYDSLSYPMQGGFVVEEVSRSPSPQEPIALWCIWQMFGYVSKRVFEKAVLRL
jgi:hypothetical protein